jgi:outer membrane protein assembly factor BamB
LLSLFWGFLYVHYTYELAMFSRFISRVIAHGILLVGFLGWWFTRRLVSLRDRFLAVGVWLLTSAIAGLLADQTVTVVGPLLFGFPFAFTVWTAWVLVSRNQPRPIQRLGFCAAIAATTSVFALVRWDGLYGDQVPQFSWRWTPTAEELFMESRGGEAAALARAKTALGSRAWTLQPGDWPGFRGANRDGVVRGVELETNWTDEPPRLIWRRRVGPAWSSMIVVDGFLVTQEQRGDYEAVVCYKAATGNEIWVYASEERFFEGLSGAGPRGTPTFSGGRIYACSANGRLTCLDATNGKLIWSRDAVREAGGDIPQWGYSVSPLAVDDKVIVFAGGPDSQSLLAYDSATGEPVWSRPGGKQTYSSPQLFTIHGRRQILMADNQSLQAVSVEDGEPLWDVPNSSDIAVPMLQPHFLGDGELLIPADPGIARVAVREQGGRWTTDTRWISRALKPDFNDFVVYENHIYGLDDGILCCVDLETGRRVWKKGRYGHGQILLGQDQGLLLVLSEKGEVALVALNPERLDELGRFQAIEGKTWNHPVVAHRQVFVRNGEEMACYRFKLAVAP